MFAQGLKQLIAEDERLFLCGVSHDARSALHELGRTPTDVLIVDISLTNSSGLEVVKTVKLDFPQMRSLVISMHDEALYGERALRAGASGYVMKQASGTMMLEAIRSVAQGKLWISEALAARMLRTVVHGSRESEGDGSPLHVLSDRELEIFQLMGNGRGTREISQSLHISVKTVESHRLNIKQKLNLKTSLDLVRHAMQWTQEVNRS